MKKLVLSAIEEYNKCHSPEATAELKEIGKNFSVIKFFGPFCRSCGVYEWFEDFRIEIEEKIKFPVKIKEIREGKNESYVVKFAFK
ncbi:MAG: hypothetical protein QW625_03990 [Candidatus Nanoarchaeia archaeon]